MNTEKVVLIIPTYNEALAIENTIRQVFSHTQTIHDFDVHVLIFDSASTDNTAAIVQGLQTEFERLHFASEERKTGLGSAYLQAMQYALAQLNADIVFEFDADLSHQPKYLAAMMEKIKTHDVIVGSRYVKGGSIPSNWGWHRKCFSRLGNIIARTLLTTKYQDFTSGFRATRRQPLSQALPKKFLSNGYAYKLELFWRLHKNKAKISEYPIDFVDRTQGHSKLPANSIQDSLRVLFRLRLRELKRYLKMCTVGLSGVIVQFISYNLLRNFLSPIHAIKISILLAIINNFILNHNFTFKTSKGRLRQNSLKKFGVFGLYSLLQIYLQSLWLQFCIHHFGTGYLEENISMAAGIFLGSVLNYIVYSRLVWR